MNGTQKLLVYEQFWNPAGLVLEIPWLELNLPARKWLSNGSWLGPSETLASSESSFYMKGLRGSHFLSLLPIRIFGVQRPPCIFTSLSLSVQVDQVPADIFLKLWIFFESYSEASFFIFSDLNKWLNKWLLRCRRPGFDPWVRKIHWRREWQPIQYSCLGNHMDRRALWATVNRVTRSQTRLSN